MYDKALANVITKLSQMETKVDEQEKEIESLRAKLKEKDETLQELQTKLAETEKKIDALYGAGQWGIQHVGAANYQHREDEALERLQSIYDAAIAKGEE